jgi:hypothetical protein
VFPRPQNERRDVAVIVVYRAPQPTRRTLAIDTAPHFVHLKPDFKRFLAVLILGIHVDKKVFSFFNANKTVFALTPKTLEISRMPLPFINILTINSFVSGFAPALAYSA